MKASLSLMLAFYQPAAREARGRLVLRDYFAFFASVLYVYVLVRPYLSRAQ